MMALLGDSELHWVYVLRFQEQGGCRLALCEKRPAASLDSQSQVAPKQTSCRSISEPGGASMITYFRKDDKRLHSSSERDKLKNVKETTMQTPRSVNKEEEEVLQVLEQRFPCSPRRRSW